MGAPGVESWTKMIKSIILVTCSISVQTSGPKAAVVLVLH